MFQNDTFETGFPEQGGRGRGGRGGAVPQSPVTFLLTSSIKQKYT